MYSENLENCNLIKNTYSLGIVTDVIGITGNFGWFGSKFNGLTGPQKDQNDPKGHLT